jgi:hypothetical protein
MMNFNEYVPEGGWIAHYQRKRAREARKIAIKRGAKTAALCSVLLLAYWAVGIIECYL